MPTETLSAREAEILRLIARGRANKEIAADLDLSVHTVERHLTNLYPKIGCRSRTEAAAFALTHRKNGKPYLAEACHPETGSFEGHDGYNHSEHYFHSSFNDLVITGLAGLRPRDDDTP